MINIDIFLLVININTIYWVINKVVLIFTLRGGVHPCVPPSEASGKLDKIGRITLNRR